MKGKADYGTTNIRRPNIGQPATSFAEPSPTAGGKDLATGVQRNVRFAVDETKPLFNNSMLGVRFWRDRVIAQRENRNPSPTFRLSDNRLVGVSFFESEAPKRNAGPNVPSFVCHGSEAWIDDFLDIKEMRP